MSLYLTTERGTVRKKWTGRLPVALIYPNTYPLAVSNLGFQLVYSLLNGQDDIVCERFVYPSAGEPLRSLESNRLLTEFPLVCASVSFEEDYPRLVAMLGAGGVEPLAAARGGRIESGQPLVVLGGVAVFMNPESLAPFADLMAIGEAEPILDGLMTVLSGLSSGKAVRRDLLLRAAMLPGCYAPGLYDFQFDDQGRVAAIRPESGVPERVRRVTAAGMNKAAHSQLFSPEAELGMFMTELGRGCGRGCRFCAAGFIYRPPRLWSVDQVLGGLSERPPDLDRIGLLGMETATTEVLDRVAAGLEESSCRLSFSSLRADRISDPLLSLLSKSGLKSVAIAPDGTSERLRRVINKGLTERDLIEAAVRLVEAGIVNLKLYVMVGLPTETDEDLAEMTDLIRRLQDRLLSIGRRRGRVCEMLLSVNSFVPKPWTPFQYLSYGGLDRETALKERDEGKAIVALQQKIKYLRKNLAGVANLHFKTDRPERVLQQAVFARGDRRLGPVLIDLAGGLSFKKAMKRHGLRAWEYAIRPRDSQEILPWDVIDHGIAKRYLWQECLRGLKAAKTNPCDTSRCRRCGVCNEEVSA